MKVYLDHNATTPVLPEVAAAMAAALGERFGNPSSLHAWGREARAAVEAARTATATALGVADKDAVVFVSGGTEADNLAVKGAACAAAARGRHIVTSAVEHHAVLHACVHLEREGFEVTYLPVDRDGMLEPEDVARAIRKDTILVSLILANNETGVLFPIPRIARLCRERGVPLHTDAVQAFGRIPVEAGALGADLISLSAHKLHGPKGIGALYIRRGTRMQALQHGGAHQRSRRAGTEDPVAAIGLAAAVEAAMAVMAEEAKRLAYLRDKLEQGLLSRVPGAVRNGHLTERLPNTTNLAFEGTESESLVLALDLEGIAASTGAACSSGSLEASHVLRAMGVPESWGAVRFSLGRGTREAEIDYVLEVLPPIVERMRRVAGLP